MSFLFVKGHRCWNTNQNSLIFSINLSFLLSQVNLPHEASVYDTNTHGERNGHVKHQGSESFSGRLDSDKTSKEFIPLFQRVLSALIIEDTIDELEEQDDNGNIPIEDAFFDPAYDTYDYDPRKRARREFEHNTMFGQTVHSVKVSFSSNGCTNTNPSINDSLCEDGNFINRPQVIQMEGFGISSFDNQYEQMRLDDKLLMELHSIGLYPELVVCLVSLVYYFSVRVFCLIHNNRVHNY